MGVSFNCLVFLLLTYLYNWVALLFEG